MLQVNYLLALFLFFKYTGKTPSQIFVMPVAWPRVLWDLLVDQPRSDANRAAGLLFITVCDTAVYGAISYVALLAISKLTRKPAVLEPPPKPEQFDSSRSTFG
jgi:hypothetical protein